MVRRYEIKIFIAIVFIIIFSFDILQAQDKWTKADMNYQVAYTVLHLIDWGQTRYISKHPNEHYEINPLIGKHPSIGRVNTFMISSLILHTGISYLLPSKYRRMWQISTGTVKSGLIIHNDSIGIKIDF